MLSFFYRRFQLKSVQDNILAALEISPDLRASIANGLIERITLSEKSFRTQPVEEHASQLRLLAEFAMRERHSALSSGANSERHPTWNMACQFETYCTARLAWISGRYSVRQYYLIESVILNFSLRFCDNQLREKYFQAVDSGNS